MIVIFVSDELPHEKIYKCKFCTLTTHFKCIKRAVADKENVCILCKHTYE